MKIDMYQSLKLMAMYRREHGIPLSEYAHGLSDRDLIVYSGLAVDVGMSADDKMAQSLRQEMRERGLRYFEEDALERGYAVYREEKNEGRKN